IQTAVPTGKKPDASANSTPASDENPRRGGMGGEKPDELYQFMLLCLDRQTGKTLWQQIAREEVPHEGIRPGEGSFAASSPMTDGQHVFGYFGSHGLYCYTMDGKLEWKKDLGKLRIKMGFG